MPLDFTAIDFETANSSNASACAVGLARVRDGEVVATAGWLIRPPAGHDRFFELNTRIHGIREEDVIGAKGWSEQLDDLAAFAGADVLVAHNAGFDMTVIRRACELVPTPRVSLKTWHWTSRRSTSRRRTPATPPRARSASPAFETAESSRRRAG